MVFRKMLTRYQNLATVEQKSFWALAPMTVIIGIVAIFTTAPYFGSYGIVATAVVGLCVIFSIAVMIICARTQNYHTCYPILCIVIGGILMPITFLVNGGFYSGMPLFCLAATTVCAFCYEKRARIRTFIISFVMTLIVFFFSKRGFNTLFAIDPKWVADDIIWCYIMLSVGLSILINLLLDETTHYVRNTEVLSDYVDSNVRKELIERANKGMIGASGVHRNVTVLFIDISGFTSTTEKMEPGLAAEYLNTFLTVADQCIHKNNGILDKYIGDCAMAYWIDADDNNYGIIQGVKTVLDVRQKLYDMSEDIFRQFKTEMDFSAGLEYGEVVLGNIGSETRKDYTIIGDAVNTASRLQHLAGRGELVVSDNVASKLGDLLILNTDAKEAYLKGKKNSVKVHRVLGLSKEAEDAFMISGSRKRETPIRDFIASFGNNSDDGDKYKLVICGCRGSYPVSGLRHSEFGGETSCYIIKKDDYAVVLDCGTGLMNAKELLADCRKIDILFTHVHYDHIIGLLDMSIFPKQAKLTMYGHFGSWAGENTIRSFIDTPYWPVPFPDIPMSDVVLGREYQLDRDIVATFYRTFHPDNGCVIKLMVGSKKVCLYADIENPNYMDAEIARGSDMLIYDGMYDREDGEEHSGWGHSTWQDGVEYAKKEQVKRLVITHHDPKLGDRNLRSREFLAKEQLDNAVFARTGDIYIL